MATKQVSEMPLGEILRHEAGPSHTGPSHKRARVSSNVDKSRSSSGSRSRTRYGGADDFPPSWRSNFPRSSGGRTSLPPVAERPSEPPVARGSYQGGELDRGHKRGNRHGGDPRSASPTPSYASSSTLSAATTSATALSSRASLSSCRSSLTSSCSSFHSSYSGSGGGRYSDGGGGSGADYFPKPLSSWSGSVNGRRRGSPAPESRRAGGRDRYPGSRSSSSGGGGRSSRDRYYGGGPPLGRRSGGGGGHKDYASEAGSSTGSSAGRKRNRSCSRERGGRGSSSCSSRRSRSAAGSSSGVECARCLEWCRYSRIQQRKPITRTLQMEYYVRTPACKAAKTKHIDFIDDVAYSREQFIEETVFTCPFTGARRDIVLERNMFPYDVPTDVEHWTLWSRKDLNEAEMESFVQAWAAENHPHVVEWECDNNEGERSIDWFHVHVFFRLGCQDRTGVPRDPASVYDGPYRPKDKESREEEVGEAVAAGASSASVSVSVSAAVPTAVCRGAGGGGGGGEPGAGGGGASAGDGAGKEGEEEDEAVKAVTDNE
eukprot:g15104.t2